MVSGIWGTFTTNLIIFVILLVFLDLKEIFKNDGQNAIGRVSIIELDYGGRVIS